MIQITKSSLFCLLGLTAGLAAQEGEVDLRIQAKKGASVWLQQESKQQQLVDMGGQEMEVGQAITTVLQVTVKDVDEKGLMVVETKVARIHGTMTMPMVGDIEFDSAKPEADAGEDGGGGFGMPSPGALAKSQTALAGKTFLAKVDPYGKVASLEGVAELLKNKGKGNPMAPQNPVTESSLRNLVEGAFGVLPAKPVAVGTAWDHKMEEAGSMPGMSIKLTLAKVDADSFQITAAGKVDPPKTDGEQTDPRRQMMDSLKVANDKVDGSQRISRQDGFVLDATYTMSMDATMDSPMGGEMSMKIKSVTTTKRTTADAATPAKADAAK